MAPIRKCHPRKHYQKTWLCRLPGRPVRFALCIGVAAMAALTFSSGCAGRLPDPSPDQVRFAADRWPGTTEENLARGRRLYVARCGGCHNLYLPGSVAAPRWPDVMNEMAPLSKLSPDEQEEILRYLMAVVN